jgi:3-oxoacyl-[acyl-carrier-protein] synthase-3
MRNAAPAAGARILGMGHHQPATSVTNQDLIDRGIDTTDEWIRSRVGIESRRHAGPEEGVVDMAEEAGSKAIAASGVDASGIDTVIVATCTMPTTVPNAAAQLAARLGIEAPGAFDINAACAGFAYATAQANALILSGQARHVLVVGAEKLTDWTNWDDRGTNIIFADGAGAAVVGPSDTPGIGPVAWGSDGSQMHAIQIVEGTHYIQQEGQAVFRWATSQIAPVALEACRLAGVEPAELAAFIPHQANLRIIEGIAKRLKLPESTAIARDIVTAGNTSSASIPLALSRMAERGEIPSGAPVLTIGFGSGLTYAGQVLAAP